MDGAANHFGLCAADRLYEKLFGCGYLCTMVQAGLVAERHQLAGCELGAGFVSGELLLVS